MEKKECLMKKGTAGSRLRLFTKPGTPGDRDRDKMAWTFARRKAKRADLALVNHKSRNGETRIWWVQQGAAGHQAFWR